MRRWVIRPTLLATLLVALVACDDNQATTAPTHQTAAYPPAPPPTVNLGVEAGITTCPCPPDGGSVLVERVDSAGRAFTLAIPNTGDGYYAAVSVSPGTYQLTYTPPMGFQLVAGEMNPRVQAIGLSTTWITFDISQ